MASRLLRMLDNCEKNLWSDLQVQTGQVPRQNLCRDKPHNCTCFHPDLSARNHSAVDLLHELTRHTVLLSSTQRYSRPICSVAHRQNFDPDEFANAVAVSLFAFSSITHPYSRKESVNQRISGSQSIALSDEAPTASTKRPASKRARSNFIDLAKATEKEPPKKDDDEDDHEDFEAEDSRRSENGDHPWFQEREPIIARR
ncbi:hypothetical protein CONLIGDRAFT_686894 [Coniochaeta ligniaria NRRL 30616]|uniref:Uncharacterized protein n=1 Tax=Coniochaeta ligniaria NRRL 30616 TaxID=1408157 RepID=A0A1J7I6Y0_9PEZI|nr:hypothetical protein CONLIGDRAFT_686894 [Coniochaeta ligniaria NRRL 30616]